MLFNQLVPIVLPVLAFGEVIPQAITRYGLAVGANFPWLVHLMIICYPVAYPIGKCACNVAGNGR